MHIIEMYKLAIAGLLVETNKLEMNKWKIWTTPSLQIKDKKNGENRGGREEWFLLHFIPGVHD